ncbi:hypothetical protein [Streptomyces sp. NBC_01294]|uniref:hypothetical protein n=1 Tax=Streptomyces sp. NBC_01294 TaxID=2903815 RepID=UPI002DD8EC38|nr:hypothetical protein [Streptomyces sp. NBC_01294]WRZ61568.1 hypothetical protein OG534_36960 [Streptomyces sp. NBC_01294]
MLLYAQTPARRTCQILADLIAVVLIAAAVKFALAVHDAIMLLAEPGRRVESSGESLATALDDAGDTVSDVPLVGDLLKKPFRSAADAGTGLADAGQSLQDTISQLATLAAVALIVVPVGARTPAVAPPAPALDPAQRHHPTPSRRTRRRRPARPARPHRTAGRPLHDLRPAGRPRRRLAPRRPASRRRPVRDRAQASGLAALTGGAGKPDGLPASPSA